MTREPQQIALPLRPARGVPAAIVPPVPIAWRKLRRVCRRVLPKLAPKPGDMLTAAQLVEMQALLDQVRKQARKQARAGGRMSKRASFAYACKPEGRRVESLKADLCARIAALESRLCG